MFHRLPKTKINSNNFHLLPAIADTRTGSKGKSPQLAHRQQLKPDRGSNPAICTKMI